MAFPISPAGRRYTRRIPKPLPLHRMISRVLPTLPASVDLLEFAGPVKDQGSEGSCTAHAGSSAMEWIFRKYLKKQPIFSPQYLYAEELLRQGDFPNDDGSDGVTLCETMIFKGCCELSEYPYIPGQIKHPTLAQDENASQHRMGAYHGLTSSRVALSVIGDRVPWPVEIGFTVYESFEKNWDIAGVMPLPQSGERVLGGHEVLMLGYDVSDTPTLRPANSPPAALILNSWGTGWGVGGYFWMPIPVLDALDTDLKICHSGHPWK